MSSLCQCDQLHLVRSSAPRSIAGHVSRNPRVALAGPMLHRFNTCAVGSYVRSITLCAIKRIVVECTSTRLNARRTEIERSAYKRTHVGVRSIAPPAIERTPDLAARFILSINRTSLFSFHFTLGYAWETF
jgi:hypothetical protein